VQVKSLKKVEENKFDLILEVSEEEANFFVNIALDYLVGTIAIIRQNREAEMDLLGQIPDEEFHRA
jgi:hypothetical protein